MSQTRAVASLILVAAGVAGAWTSGISACFADSVDSYTGVGDGVIFQTFGATRHFMQREASEDNPWLRLRNAQEENVAPSAPVPTDWYWNLAYTVARITGTVPAPALPAGVRGESELAHTALVGIGWEPLYDWDFTMNIPVQSNPTEGYRSGAFEFVFSHLVSLREPNEREEREERARGANRRREERIAFFRRMSDRYRDDRDPDRRGDDDEPLAPEDPYPSVLVRFKYSYTRHLKYGPSVRLQNVTLGSDPIVANQGLLHLEGIFQKAPGFSWRVELSKGIYPGDPTGLVSAMGLGPPGIQVLNRRAGLIGFRSYLEGFRDIGIALGATKWFGETWELDGLLAFDTFSVSGASSAFAGGFSLAHDLDRDWKIGVGLDVTLAGGASLLGSLNLGYAL